MLTSTTHLTLVKVSNVRTADVTIGWREALDEAERHVQRILDRLPLRERQFLEAMAALPPKNRSLTSIAQQMGYGQAQQAGPYSQRLDRQRGILARDSKPYRFRHRAVGAYLTTDWPDVS